MESAPVSADLILNVSDAPALSELVDLEKNEQADSSSKKSKATDAPAVNNVDAMDIDREPLPAEVSAPAPVPIPSVDHVVIVDEVCPYDAAKLLLRPEEYYIDDEDYIINASLSKVSGPRTKSHRSVKPRVRKPSLDDVVAPKRRAGKRKRRGYGNDEARVAWFDLSTDSQLIFVVLYSRTKRFLHGWLSSGAPMTRSNYPTRNTIRTKTLMLIRCW
jgi:hypothetical protein